MVLDRRSQCGSQHELAARRPWASPCLMAVSQMIGLKVQRRAASAGARRASTSRALSRWSGAATRDLSLRRRGGSDEAVEVARRDSRRVVLGHHPRLVAGCGLGARVDDAPPDRGGGRACQACAEVGPELAVCVRRGERVTGAAALSHPDGEPAGARGGRRLAVVTGPAAGSPPSPPLVNARTAMAAAASTRPPAIAVAILTPRAQACAATPRAMAPAIQPEHGDREHECSARAPQPAGGDPAVLGCAVAGGAATGAAAIVTAG